MTKLCWGLPVALCPPHPQEAPECPLWAAVRAVLRDKLGQTGLLASGGPFLQGFHLLERRCPDSEERKNLLPFKNELLMPQHPAVTHSCGGAGTTEQHEVSAASRLFCLKIKCNLFLLFACRPPCPPPAYFINLRSYRILLFSGQHRNAAFPC